MIRRISCKVVKSLPLAGISDTFVNTHYPNYRSGWPDNVVAVQVTVKGTSSPVVGTGLFGRSKSLLERYPAGQFLDCYV